VDSERQVEGGEFNSLNYFFYETLFHYGDVVSNLFANVVQYVGYMQRQALLLLFIVLIALICVRSVNFNYCSPCGKVEPSTVGLQTPNITELTTMPHSSSDFIKIFKVFINAVQLYFDKPSL